MAPARREFDRLPISVAAAVLETLDAIAENPRRLGKRLIFEHEGRFSARRGPYRIIYESTRTSASFVSSRSGTAATSTAAANAMIELGHCHLIWAPPVDRWGRAFHVWRLR